jgi:hypothetical protein
MYVPRCDEIYIPGTKYFSGCMEGIINQVLESVVGGTGKIIGLSLAIRLGLDELERVRAMNREIEGFSATGKGISVSFRPGTGRGRMALILGEIVNSLARAYRGVIGDVALTLVKNSLESAARKYGSEYPEIRKLAARAGKEGKH